MPEANPYQPTAAAAQISAATPNAVNWDLRTISVTLRWLNIAIVFDLFAELVQSYLLDIADSSGDIGRLLLALTAVVTQLGMIFLFGYLGFRLTKALCMSTSSRRSWTIGVGLTRVLAGTALRHQATKRLKAAGIKVGLLGVSPESLPLSELWPDGQPPERSQATRALVFALLSYVSFGFFLSIPAVVLARGELEAIRASRRSASNSGRARAALWIGSADAALSIVLLGVALVAGLSFRRDYQRDLAKATVGTIGQTIVWERTDLHALIPACVMQVQNLAAAQAPEACGHLPSCHENAYNPCWGGPYWAVENDPWGHSYRLALDPTTGTLTVSSDGQDGVPGDADDVVSTTEGVGLAALSAGVGHNGWTEVNASEWGFKVSFPQIPTSVRKDEDSGTEQRLAKLWLDQRDAITYSVSSAHFQVDSKEHRQSLADDEQNHLDGYPEDGWTLVSKREVSVANPEDPRKPYLCHEVEEEHSAGAIKRWFGCLAGAQFFQLTCGGPETAQAGADWAAFTGSFALTGPQPSPGSVNGPVMRPCASDFACAIASAL